MNDSIVLRRMDRYPFIAAGVLPLCTAWALWITWPRTSGDVMVAAMAVLLVWVICYIGGPSAHIRVTPDALIVANTFIVHRVPRSALRTVGGYNSLGVNVVLSDGRELSIGAFNPPFYMFDLRSRGGYARRGRQLLDAVDAIKPTPPANQQPFMRRPRWDNLTIIAIAVPILYFGTKWGLFHG